MQHLTWLGLGCLVAAVVVFGASAAIGLWQRITLARLRIDRTRMRHPFRDHEPLPLPKEVSPVLVWPALGLLAVASCTLALAPREQAPALSAQDIATACTDALGEMDAPDPSCPTPPLVLPVIATASSAGALQGAPVDRAFTFGWTTPQRGRTTILRMSSDVLGLDGTSDEHGFTVTVRGALSLDRAGPIAAANPSIERASILNRGDHCVLTVRFVEGRPPVYRVDARGAQLVVTVGR